MFRCITGAKEAIELLKGEGPEDLQDLVMKLGMEIVRLAGVAGSTLSQNRRTKIEDGSALENSKTLLLPKAEYQGDRRSRKTSQSKACQEIACS